MKQKAKTVDMKNQLEFLEMKSKILKRWKIIPRKYCK